MRQCNKSEEDCCLRATSPEVGRGVLPATGRSVGSGVAARRLERPQRRGRSLPWEPPRAPSCGAGIPDGAKPRHRLPLAGFEAEAP